MIKKLLREPLVHFLFFGFLLFLYYQFQNDGGDPSEKRIVLTDTDLDRLVSNYQMSWSEPPSATILQRLVQEEIKSEIYYKEALGMGLDDNDEIIRRRLKQKYEFLMKDLGEQMNPSENELRLYHEKNQDVYKGDRKVTFDQFYFSPDNHSNPEQQAKAAFERFSVSEDIQGLSFGDRSHLKKQWINATSSQLRQTFGMQFDEALAAVGKEGWTAPLPSGLGFHVVYVHEISPAVPLSFDEVAASVRQDWIQNKTVQIDSINFSQLSADYDIEYEGSKYTEVIAL